MHRSATAIGLALALGICGAARAGVYSDDLAKCLVKSATPADQTQLMIWMFAAFSAHPAVQPYSSFTPAQREQATKTAAGLFQRLILKDCHTETVAALKYEGMSALERGFEVLGQVAVRGLMSDAKVEQSMQSLGAAFDAASVAALLKEAGVATEPPKKN